MQHTTMMETLRRLDLQLDRVFLCAREQRAERVLNSTPKMIRKWIDQKHMFTHRLQKSSNTEEEPDVANLKISTARNNTENIETNHITALFVRTNTDASEMVLEVQFTVNDMNDALYFELESIESDERSMDHLNSQAFCKARGIKENNNNMTYNDYEILLTGQVYISLQDPLDALIRLTFRPFTAHANDTNNSVFQPIQITLCDRIRKDHPFVHRLQAASTSRQTSDNPIPLCIRNDEEGQHLLLEAQFTSGGTEGALFFYIEFIEFAPSKGNPNPVESDTSTSFIIFNGMRENHVDFTYTDHFVDCETGNIYITFQDTNAPRTLKFTPFPNCIRQHTDDTSSIVITLTFPPKTGMRRYQKMPPNKYTRSELKSATFSIGADGKCQLSNRTYADDTNLPNPTRVEIGWVSKVQTMRAWDEYRYFHDRETDHLIWENKRNEEFNQTFLCLKAAQSTSKETAYNAYHISDYRSLEIFMAGYMIHCWDVSI